MYNVGLWVLPYHISGSPLFTRSNFCVFLIIAMTVAPTDANNGFLTTPRQDETGKYSAALDKVILSRRIHVRIWTRQ